jgi:poly(A) polymerase
MKNDAVDLAGPTAFDQMASEKLEAFMAVASPTETQEEQDKRTRIITTFTALFRDWVRSVCLAKGYDAETANRAGGLVLTSGSYRLGLNERGTNIDTICVAPRMVTRDDFFDSLKVILEDRDEVENLSAVETAKVPIITFDFDGVNLDLLFAQLPLDAVPETLDVNDDAVLQGVDFGTEKSLNGPRVTNLIEQLVPSFTTFRSLLRCVRLWAKRRGLYSNKMGYLGGVNCNILSAFICQMYPNAAVSVLLQKFFSVLREWPWPTPIEITPQYDAGLGLERWDTSQYWFHVMPILTPAYPSMNSTANVSHNTLDVMKYEMDVAHERVGAALATGGDGWASVFEPTDFVVSLEKYLAVEMFVRGVPEHEHASKLQGWCGYIESRLRFLAENLDRGLPLVNVRLLPQKLPLLSERALSDAQGGDGQAFLIGFDVDRDSLQGTDIDLTDKVESFKKEVYAGAIKNGLLTESVTREHLRLRVAHFSSWSDMPNDAFASLGGRDAAFVQQEAQRSLSAAHDALVGVALGAATGTSAEHATRVAANHGTVGKRRRVVQDEQRHVKITSGGGVSDSSGRGGDGGGGSSGGGKGSGGKGYSGKGYGGKGNGSYGKGGRRF